MADYKERYQQWLTSDAIDEATKEELRSIKDDDKEIQERFYKDLEFGTGGLRGVIAAGTNRMNVYTVRRATQGLVNYLIKKDPKAKEKGIAVAYDSRHMSDVFARETAAVANASGMKAYVFESLRPTPELSFAIRTLGCKGGVVITASHNPSKYNGYKAYWEDGCQVPPPMDEEIIDEVEKVDLFDGVRAMPRSEAEAKGLYIEIGEDIDKKFIDTASDMIIDKEAVKKYAKDLKIVYTPLHGTGRMPVMRALKQAGFEPVIVPSQEMPDGDFPTCPYPNPEVLSVFEPAQKLADQIGADICIATDPDADRMGILVRTKDGVFHQFTGNMTGTLLLSYILEARKKTDTLPKDGFIVKTIVSTEMARAIAESYGVEVRDVLTGFKFIGQQITNSVNTGIGHYLFGFEVSYGYLCGTYARDKDSVSAVLMISEMAAIYKAKGMTLVDALEALYKKYGYYKEETISLTFEGLEGADKIRDLMDSLRNNHKDSYGGLKVQVLKDYSKGIDGLPKSNVLRFTLEDNCWFCVRPSGTEPKIKFYFGVKGKDEKEAETMIETLKKDVLPNA